MCQILFFHHKKHLFDVDGSLNNSVLSKRCFFRYNRFVIHPLSGWFSVSVASAPSTAWRLLPQKRWNLCGSTSFGLRKRAVKTQPLKFGGAEGQNRTAHTGIFSPLLYQLSYLGTTKVNLLQLKTNGKLFLSFLQIFRCHSVRFPGPFGMEASTIRTL